MQIEKPAVKAKVRDRSNRLRTGIRLEIKAEWVDLLIELTGEKARQLDVLSPEFKLAFALHTYLSDRRGDK